MTSVSSTVDRMIEDVIRREGGFVDHPADRGGPTKFGITQATLAGYCGHSVGAAEVAALNADQAKQIYRCDYYFAPHIDQQQPIEQGKDDSPDNCPVCRKKHQKVNAEPARPAR